MDLLHYWVCTFGKTMTLPKDGHGSKACKLLLELFCYFQGTRIAAVSGDFIFFSVKTVSIFEKQNLPANHFWVSQTATLVFLLYFSIRMKTKILK